MDMQGFVEFAKRTSGGTYSVSNRNYEWEILHKSYVSGYQVGIGNLALIPLRRDGEDICPEIIDESIRQAVASFMWGSTTFSDDIDRSLGLWVENEVGGDATLYIDNTVWVADQLSANIVGAVLGEKEIYDWENDKCLTVVKAGK